MTKKVKNRVWITPQPREIAFSNSKHYIRLEWRIVDILAKSTQNQIDIHLHFI